ncbi:antibiotic biosynthesis monooxygenase [Hymenobacter perfusus]|uniref:ABM domain-containing protein n=1 Tax=Hymenobacter perfusus TaxID=1236770 RepID=A0A3R9P144_9BACT|nr:antibiotic biosynthesis monooxygenase [Hymenobacter perfusus]RSK46370.1 hypothetical protein EI293_04160 [Hymenobacter perfusus]
MGTILAALSLLLPGCVLAQTTQADGTRTQVATIIVEAAQLDQYRIALREEVETSLRVEPGVLLFAVTDQRHPTHMTILERCASEAACIPMQAVRSRQAHDRLARTFGNNGLPWQYLLPRGQAVLS